MKVCMEQPSWLGLLSISSSFLMLECAKHNHVIDACVINIIEIKQRRKTASCSTKGQLAAADEVCVCVWPWQERRDPLCIPRPQTSRGLWPGLCSSRRTTGCSSTGSSPQQTGKTTSYHTDTGDTGNKTLFLSLTIYTCTIHTSFSLPCDRERDVQIFKLAR